MKKLVILFLVSVPFISVAQNVGIGTANPQQKLHVAGSIRSDALSGSNGVLKYNSSGDLVTLPNSGNSNDVLLGNGAWGAVDGTVPTGTIVATENYNDPALLNKGFNLYGSIPGYSKFISSSFTANPSTWAVTYFKGNLSKYSPPPFDGDNLIVWADTVLYVFSDNRLYAYNPISDIWRLVLFNLTSFRASPQSKAVWTGTEILVWGGYYNSSTNNGFRYNPGTNTWAAIPETNQPVARYGFAMRMVNNSIVVWGGVAVSGGTSLNTGAVLNLASNTWTTTSTTGAPTARADFSSVVNTAQSTMIVWGGNATPGGITNTGAIYNPSTNSWSAITNTGAPVARDLHTAVWSGSEMIVFGGRDSFGNGYNSGGRYNPVTNAWMATSTTGVVARIVPSAVWIGSRMLITGGTTGSSTGPVYSANAYLYDPITNSWSTGGNMGVAKGSHSSFMADNIVMIMGGVTSVYNAAVGAYSNDPYYPQGARYFLVSTATSKTEVLNRADLYLYIK
ncbi:MAG: hypothetical protein JNJ86_05360 [Chitinophagaceae bacterium]|nr:hypothetical protein [Chitinophagaceae bacterium]